MLGLKKLFFMSKNQNKKKMKKVVYLMVCFGITAVSQRLAAQPVDHGRWGDDSDAPTPDIQLVADLPADPPAFGTFAPARSNVGVVRSR